jgi:hypothetical protein
MMKLISICIFFILTAVSIQAETNSPEISTKPTDIKKKNKESVSSYTVHIQGQVNSPEISAKHTDSKNKNDAKEKNRESVNPHNLTRKRTYFFPSRVDYYIPYQMDVDNTKPNDATTQDVSPPVVQDILPQEPKDVIPESAAQPIDKSVYVDSTDIGKNRGKQIPLSVKYKDTPQIISEKFQIYNVTKISNFRSETDKMMIESSSGTYAIPKDLIKDASIRYFTPELTIQLNQYLK